MLEFGTYIAGPLIGKHLADMGAQVTQVVRPPHCRGAVEEGTWNQDVASYLSKNKERIQLDLKTSEGNEDARKLILEACPGSRLPMPHLPVCPRGNTL